MKILGELVEKGLTLDDIEKFLHMQKRFEKLGVSFEEFLGFLEELRVNNIELKDLIFTHRMLKEEGLTVGDVKVAVFSNRNSRGLE